MGGIEHLDCRGQGVREPGIGGIQREIEGDVVEEECELIMALAL
jgi:hypothetical protein